MSVKFQRASGAQKPCEQCSRPTIRCVVIQRLVTTGPLPEKIRPSLESFQMCNPCWRALQRCGVGHLDENDAL